MCSVRNARIFDKVPASEGVRVLVMRRWPRGLSREAIDIWLPDAGPSFELLSYYRAGLVSWEEFLTRYTEEQQETIIEGRLVVYFPGQDRLEMPYIARPVEVLACLARHLPQPLVLLCWEWDLCHRFTLENLVCAELQKGMYEPRDTTD